MARIYVVPEDFENTDDAMDRGIEVRQNEENGWTFGICPRCRQKITDRGHFEDTVQEISTHLDQC